jgi:hypothetical protein
MRILLRAVGGVWATFGVFNILLSSAWKGGEGAIAFVLIFNFILFILPGLVLSGLGSLIGKSGTKAE